MRNFKSFFGARDGNIAMLFGLTLPLFLLFTGGAVDFSRYNAVRADLIESLDAAGLAIAQLDAANGPELRSLTEAERTAYLKEFGRDFFDENFSQAGAIDNLVVEFDINDLTITPRASGRLRTLLLGAFTALSGRNNDFTYISVDSDTEITRAANGDTEVALILDTTGSMANDNRIQDLRAAAREFVDVLVREDQTDYFSKVAVVPYGGSVRVGAHATAARGAITPPKTITGINRNSRATITAPNHGFTNGQFVRIAGVLGMTQINSTTNSGADPDHTSSSPDPGQAEHVYVVQNATTNTFQLRHVNEHGNAATGNWVDSSGFNTYTGGGSVHCTRPGCQFHFFLSDSGDDWRLFEITDCVSERTGVNAYTDESVTVSKVGHAYGRIGGAYVCPPSQVAGLTSDKEDLFDTIDALQANGNTGGHTGVAWGWYAISPNFSNLFTGDSAPSAWDNDEVAKSVVLMTDGEYNSAYCDGVVSQDSTSGSGPASDHINCDAPNGHSYDQALALCEAMKDKGVVVYTVGFKIVNSQNARDLMSNCATSSAHEYLAEDGAALKRHFAAIAQSISQLHVSR
jgi:Flp pilus assembly protein TadG